MRRREGERSRESNLRQRRERGKEGRRKVEGKVENMVSHTRCLHIYAESAAPSRNWLHAKQPYENPLCFVYFKVKSPKHSFPKSTSALTCISVQKRARNCCQGIPQLRNVRINIITTSQIVTNNAVVRTFVTNRTQLSRC